MTADVVTIEPDTSIGQAVEIMRTRGIRHLPVLSDGRLVGVATDRDVRLPPDPDEGAPHSNSPVSRVMTEDVLTTTPDTPVEAAARQLIERRIGCLPVIDDGRLVGILTGSDLLRAFVELMVSGERYTRIELLAPDRPGELARVVRLIGIDHRINIRGMVVPPTTGDRALVVLHLETEGVEPLLTQLRNIGYEAGSPALENRPE